MDPNFDNLAYGDFNQNDSPRLSLFDISWSDVLIPLVASHLTLKDLFSLRCCSRTAKYLAECVLETLKEINLSGNNSKNVDLTFAVLVKCCTHLERIHLAKCNWLSDDLLLPILVENTWRLREVNLNECVNITPLALQPIIIECKNLRILKLSKCQWLTTGAVDALTLHQSKLEEFDISHCTSIGERCLIIFFRKLNKLTVLSLAHTPSVTDQVLIQIGNFCRALEHINLVGCSAISDFGVHAIARNCTQLKSLYVKRCPRVSERSLASLRKHIYIDRPNQLDMNPNDFYPSDFLLYYSLTSQCTQLKSLMVHHCPRVSERVLAPLRGRVHIDRPSLSYNVPAMLNQLYLQV